MDQNIIRHRISCENFEQRQFAENAFCMLSPRIYLTTTRLMIWFCFIINNDLPFACVQPLSTYWFAADAFYMLLYMLSALIHLILIHHHHCLIQNTFSFSWHPFFSLNIFSVSIVTRLFIAIALKTILGYFKQISRMYIYP